MHGKIESLVEGLKDYPQRIVNVKVRSKPPLETLPEVSRALAEAQSALETTAASSFATPAPSSSPASWSRPNTRPTSSASASPSPTPSAPLSASERFDSARLRVLKVLRHFFFQFPRELFRRSRHYT